MAGEADGDVVVPPTLQALLAARLDQLEPAERSVLERGAVEGEVFHRGAVQALAPERAQVTPRLAALVRKELITPGPAAARRRGRLPLPPPADPRRRLRRAPEGGPRRAARALRRLARGARRRARRARRDPRLPPRAGLPLPRRARAARRRRAGRGGAAPPDRRPAAARRAAQDYGAAASLLERAAALVPPDEFDLALETRARRRPSSGQAGATTRSGARILSPSAPRPRATGSASSAGGSRRASIRLDLEPEGAAEKLDALVERGAARLRGRRRRPALCTSPTPRSARSRSCARRSDAALDGIRAGRRPRAAGGHAARARGLARRWPPLRHDTRVGVLAWLDENEPRAGPRPLAPRIPSRGAGDARPLRRGARDPRRDRERSWPSAAAALQLAVTHRHRVRRASSSWPATPPPPPSSAQKGAGCSRSSGEQGFLSTAAACSRRRSTQLDRLDEADAWAGRAAELGASDDAFTQMLWRQVRAKVLARRGEHAEAERLAREAVAIGETHGLLNGQGDAYADLAEVLLLGGRPTRQPPRSSRRSSATSARRTSSAERTRARLARAR